MFYEPEGLALQEPRVSPWVGIKENLQPEGLPEGIINHKHFTSNIVALAALQAAILFLTLPRAMPWAVAVV